MKSFACLFALAAVVLAEPPVPSDLYGIPSASYGPPSHTQALLRPNGNGNGHSNGNGRLSAQYGAPRQQYGVPEQEAPASYHFEWAVKDDESGNDFGHEESREGDVATGRYYVLLPDGRKQIVEYTADNEGYNPKITYEDAANGGYPRGPTNGGYPRGPAHGSGNGHHVNGNDGYRY